MHRRHMQERKSISPVTGSRTGTVTSEALSLSA
jgi:hypothetical protein